MPHILSMPGIPYFHHHMDFWNMDRVEMKERMQATTLTLTVFIVLIKNISLTEI